MMSTSRSRTILGGLYLASLLFLIYNYFSSKANLLSQANECIGRIFVSANGVNKKAGWQAEMGQQSVGLLIEKLKK